MIFFCINFLRRAFKKHDSCSYRVNFFSFFFCHSFYKSRVSMERDKKKKGNVYSCLSFLFLFSLAASSAYKKKLSYLHSTFVCPTELIAFSDNIAAFQQLNCEVVGVSTDSHFSHLAWNNMPRKVSGKGGGWGGVGVLERGSGGGVIYYWYVLFP